MSHLTSFNTVMSFLAKCLPPVVAAPPAYPFIGVKSVKSRLEADPEVQKATLVMLHFLQTESEQAKRDTEVKNLRGFMSSDAWHGSRIAERLIAGMEIAAEDEARIVKIASKYSKQLSVQLRRMAMVENPALASYAQLFSVT